MSAQNGALVLIKVGNGGSPEAFTTLGGLRVSEMLLNNQMLNASNVEAGAWRQLSSGLGLHSMTISGSGIFTDAASEETARGYAFANEVHNYQFIFANGDRVSGPFQITSYLRNGTHEDAENYTLRLESAGDVTFTAA